MARFTIKATTYAEAKKILGIAYDVGGGYSECGRAVNGCAINASWDRSAALVRVRSNYYPQQWLEDFFSEVDPDLITRDPEDEPRFSGDTQ